MWKNDPLFLGFKNHESFGFFDFEPKSVFGSRLHRVCVAEVGPALMQFMQFSAIFGMSAILATLVTPWYPL